MMDSPLPQPVQATPPDSQRHGIEIAPLPSVASPHAIEFEDGNEQWWRPTWGEIWKHLGYRRLLFLPSLGVLALIILMFFDSNWWLYFWWLGLKAGVLLLTIPFALAAYGVTGATKTRKDVFCIHCGYSLEGLPDNHICPECGRRYNFAQSEEYRRDPAWFIQRWRQRRLMPPSHGQIMAGAHQSKRRNKDGT